MILIQSYCIIFCNKSNGRRRIAGNLLLSHRTLISGFIALRRDKQSSTVGDLVARSIRRLDQTVTGAALI